MLRIALVLLIVGCGSSSSGTGDGDAGTGSGDGDGGTGTGTGACDPTYPQCNNCIDDDGDGFIDALDPECSGALDDREDSFATGIPGDNVDPVLQDCFFDGNSGEGDDGCFRPTCCLTDGVGNGCPPPGPPPNDCTVSQQCIDFCAPLTPPGCDCFGCCEVCDSTGCYDIAVGLATSDCTAGNLQDTTACPRCVMATDCTSTCDSGNGTPCDANGACADGAYCDNGCCVSIIL